MAEKKKQLSPTGLKLAEHASTRYRVAVEDDVVLQDVVKATFWEHHAKKLRVLDIIEVICDDLSWYAELFVVHSEGPYVKVRVINYTALTQSAKDKGDVDPMEIAKDHNEIEANDDQKFVVKFIPSKLWSIRKDESGSPWIKDGLASKADAHLWVKEHNKTMRK